MIEQVGQGRMLARLKPTTLSVTRSAGACWSSLRRRSRCSTWIGASDRAAVARQRNPAPSQRQVEQAQREEGEAILALADAALAGKATAVGLLAPVAERLRQGAAWDVRAVYADGRRVSVHPANGAGLRAGRSALGKPRAGLGRQKAERRRAGEESTYPVDAIFPVDLPAWAERRVSAAGFRCGWRIRRLRGDARAG